MPIIKPNTYGAHNNADYIHTQTRMLYYNVRKQTQANKEKIARTLGSLQTTHRCVAAQKQDDRRSDAPLGFTQ